MPEVDDPQEIALLWQPAIVEYEKSTQRILPPETLEDLRNAHSTDGILEKIVDSGQSFKNFRSKRAGLCRKIKIFASPLQTILTLASTSSTVADAFGIPVSTVIGACVYLIKSCENVSNAYDWIEQLFSELQEFSERLNFYVQTRIDPVLKTKVVAILAFVLKVIGRSEYLIRRNRFGEYLRVTFLGKDEKTKNLLDELNKLFSSEQRFVLAVTYAATQEIKAAQDGQDHKLDQIREKMSDAELKAQSVEFDNVLRRVLYSTSAPDDVEDTFAMNKRSLVEGTGAWMEREGFFNAWLDHRASILWVFGGPGVGKSYLSTWIIQKLLIRRPSGASVAYFFVKENSQVLRDANVILKTLAWQLVEQDPDFKRHAAQVCQTRSLTITAEDTWENLFLTYYGREEDRTQCFATIVIDGLDEATKPTRRTLLEFMKGLVSKSRSSSKPAIQFAVVGRMSLREEVEFKRQEKGFIIEVSKSKNQQDIDCYIKKRLQEVEVLRELRKIRPGGLKRAKKAEAVIRARLLKGSDGVFLWAKLLIDTILHQTLEKIETSLRNPPGDLDDMIRSVFQRLANDDEIDHDRLRKMFLFCAHAQRPLKFGELDLILSLPRRQANLLQWKQMRGKLSSILDLKFPMGYDPDQDDEVEIEDEDDESETGGSDFSSDIGLSYNDDDGDDDDDDVFKLTAEHGLQSLSLSIEPDSTNQTIHHLSDGQIHTTVTFCHARIRDFLVSEGKHRVGADSIAAVIPSFQNAHVEIVISCLDILRLQLSLREDQRYLTAYPMCYLAVHLKHVQGDIISDEDYQRIAEGLYWLFGTEIGARCFIAANQWFDTFNSTHGSFYKDWVGEDQNLSMVQRWLREAVDREGVEKKLDAAARSWMRDAGNSYERLLRPLMMAASRIWLARSGYDSPDYDQKGEFPCWLLRGWLSLANTGQVSLDIPDFEYDSFWNRFDLLQDGELEALANWAGLEHDTHWHTCLGWLLTEAGESDEAILHYQEAVSQDPGAWVALEGWATIFGQRGEYQRAIDCMIRATKAVPRRIEYIAASLYASISEWSEILDLPEQQLEAARRGFELYAQDIRSQTMYLRGLAKRGDSEAIMDVIQFLNDQMEPGVDYSWLARSFIWGFEAYDEIGEAVRKSGQPTWVLDAMESAIQKADQTNRNKSNVRLLFEMALFSYRWYDNSDEQTIKLAEVFLDRLGLQAADIQGMFASQRNWARNQLAQLYFDEAVASHMSGNVAHACVEKLKTLAVSIETSFALDYDGFDFYLEDYPSLLWGRWLREYQQAEEKVWRKCFKSRLLCQMNSLDDDDPANDTAGIISLAKSLFHAGDRHNAAAILSFLFIPLPDAEAAADEYSNEVYEPEDDRPAGSKEPATGTAQATSLDATAGMELAQNARALLPLNVIGGGRTVKCDSCSRQSPMVTEMYCCEVCDDVDWCGDCLRILKDGGIGPSLAEHKCNPKHAFYRMWPIAEEAKGLAAEYLNGAAHLKREWLESLRTKWLEAV